MVHQDVRVLADEVARRLRDGERPFRNVCARVLDERGVRGADERTAITKDIASLLAKRRRRKTSDVVAEVLGPATASYRVGGDVVVLMLSKGKVVWVSGHRRLSHTLMLLIERCAEEHMRAVREFFKQSRERARKQGTTRKRTGRPAHESQFTLDV